MGSDHTLNHYVEELSPTEFIDRLPAYDSYDANFARLDQIRQIVDSFNYAPLTLAFPFGPTTGLTFAGFSTKEGSLQIPVGSYLLGVTGIGLGDISTPTVLAPFRFSITDKGSGLGIAERSFIYNLLSAGNSATSSPLTAETTGLVTSVLNTGAYPYWLDSPFIITSPGQVQIAITNLLSTSIVAQMAFHFAYPINNVSVNTPVIKPTN